MRMYTTLDLKFYSYQINTTTSFLPQHTPSQEHYRLIVGAVP